MNQKIIRRIAAIARLQLVATLLLAPIACNGDTPTEPVSPDVYSNEAVLDWSTAAYEAFMTHDGYANPLDAVRVFAMVHLAQHDALTAISPVWEAYAFEASDPYADPRAAAAAAAHGVLVSIFPAQRTSLDDQLSESLQAVPDGIAEDRGVVLGEAAAATILEERASDGSDAPIVGDYVPDVAPGRYRFTPPFDFAFQPGWAQLKPFALYSADQFRVPPPPALGGEAYAEDFEDVKVFGRRDSAVRTTDQTAYAKFWYEFSDIGWNRVARTVAADRELGLQATARLFALLNIALSDAYVAGWDSKFHYDFWRPHTAIREAQGDGNPGTQPDPAWESELQTPPVQDYPSTHSALGDAGAEVLASVFGDETPFTFTSTTAEPEGVTRSYASFSQAADENADSRVMAGIHFRFACEAGQALGRQVGQWTVQKHLRPR
jgi:hypothetical protein